MTLQTTANRQGKLLRRRLNFCEHLTTASICDPTLPRYLSPGLKELFRRLRRKLREEGRKLVLLLEDVTSFQGVDNLLIDVLVTDSQTRPDECDLISVVGLTPDYFDKFIGV